MPAFRPSPQRSSRLQALTNRPFFMAGKARPIAGTPNTLDLNPTQAVSASQRGGMPPKKRRGRGSKATPAPTPSSTSAGMSAPAPSAPAPTKKTSTANITWDERRTDMLVTWITSRAADRHVLFHDRSSSTSTTLTPGDKPSGKNKKDVSAAIAKHIFEDDPDHSSVYAAEPTKYVTSVINRLGA